MAPGYDPPPQDDADAEVPEGGAAAAEGPASSARAHFASLKLRTFDEIFSPSPNGVISRVFAEGEQGLPWVRYVTSLGMLAGVALNTTTILQQYIHFCPDPLQLAGRWGNGTHFSDSRDCNWNVSVSNNGTFVPSQSCARLEYDQRALMLIAVYGGELIMLLGALLVGLMSICSLRTARTDVSTFDGLSKWDSVAYGFEMVEFAATCSAIKALPGMKTLPQRAARNYKFKINQLTVDDGNLSRSEQMYAVCLLLSYIVFGLLFVIVGIIALLVKIESLVYLFDTPVTRWEQPRWIAFVGFANQVAGLVPVSRVQKEAFLFFIFTGEDAELQIHEYTAMREFNATLHQHIFRIFGTWRGCIAGLTISSDDLQRVVITEEGGMTVEERTELAMSGPGDSAKTWRVGTRTGLGI
eukprot:TRINITY_DN15509_c0_g1_i1.p1 TRINITY_DN15509_c0_g1~~TRINITY_DN15509_c0_g1_i1.p1  ORF type:complete len:456 (+),score=134.39 TRINITY_DN15509_c0_g1_i1:137-1369(+)